ncbi:MAG TPA: DUF3107 domain-containing protein [Acidimicrobiales bacterium]|nr:DUF3107 domain-containing protein [Acidimicrobiales bacterium]
MDVRIGVTQSPREIEVELADNTSADELVAKIDAAVTSATGMLWLSDKRGRRVGIPAAKLAYVELDSGAETRRVGFGAAV